MDIHDGEARDARQRGHFQARARPAVHGREHTPTNHFPRTCTPSGTHTASAGTTIRSNLTAAIPRRLQSSNAAERNTDDAGLNTGFRCLGTETLMVLARRTAPCTILTCTPDPMANADRAHDHRASPRMLA